MAKDKLTTEKSVDIQQRHEKDHLQKKMAADQAKPKCTICGRYTDKKTPPQCYGHGGGGGSDGGDSNEKVNKSDATILAKTPGHGDKENQVVAASAMNHSIALTPQSELNDINFNPEVISELLSKKLLTIDNDREKGILTIRLLCDINLLSVEQKNELKKFINAILNELNTFKKEKGLSGDCYTAEKDKDENILLLRIVLPTPTLYDAFIQRLADKNLLPIQNREQKQNEKVVYPEGMNHFNPAPFSIKPTPANKKLIEDAEADKSHAKKSSIRPKSPLDGLKPKGW